MNRRARARQNRLNELLGIPVAPPPPATLQPAHALVLDHWFDNGCRSKRAAVIACGYNGAYAAAIFNRPEVQKEIDRRRERLDYKREVTEARIEQEFAKIAFANFGDMLEIQDDGSAWVDMAALNDDQKAALAEYHVETYQEMATEDTPGREVKKSRVKFHDKLAALNALAKIKGMMKEKVEISVGLSLAEKVQKARERIAVSRDTSPIITPEGVPVHASQD